MYILKVFDHNLFKIIINIETSKSSKYEKNKTLLGLIYPIIYG